VKYAGIVKQSFVDYPGKIAAVLFTRGCNFRCPFCHNGHLLTKIKKPEEERTDIEKVLDFLRERKGFLDAVVLSGGEPTLNEGLPEDLLCIKEMGYLVKIDTNGSNLHMLEKLVEEKLVDYVAMDVKAPLQYKKYLQASGRLSPGEFFNVKNSINFLNSSDVKVEFRTTVVPVLHDFEDIIEIASHLEGAEVYSLQQFRPEHALNPLYRTVVPYSREEMQAMADGCASFVKKVNLLNM